MVFTALQITAFFEDAGQMGLSNRTRVYLQGKGITTPNNLVEFLDDNIWDQILKNCRSPPQVLNADGDLVDQQAFLLPAK